MHANQERIIELVEKVTAAEDTYQQFRKDLYGLSREMKRDGISIMEIGCFVGVKGPKRHLEKAGERVEKLFHRYSEGPDTMDSTSAHDAWDDIES
jgi:hypothetical protein